MQRWRRFAIAGQLGVADLIGDGGARLLGIDGPVADPRPAPDGSDLLAFVAADRLVIASHDGQIRQVLDPPARADLRAGRVHRR